MKITEKTITDKKITGDWLDNPDTQAVCTMLQAGGHAAHFVGGCVRNAILGTEVNDLDIATDAHPDEVLTLAEAAGLKAIPTGIDHGTITVVSGHIPHEITTYRQDVATDGRRATVAFASDMVEDARRRDFTMNALYAGADGVVVDPLGQGLADLLARRLRFIEDPERRIREDYLRILRYFRFHAWYGDPQGGVDAAAMAAIGANLDGLAALSRERVGAEVVKLLQAPDPVPAVAAMRASGVLTRVWPGAEDRALGPLVHLEQHWQLGPDAMRRLAALGGSDDGRALRLSNAQRKALAQYRDGMASAMGAGELAYRLGPAVALDIVLLRAAQFETPPDPGVADQLAAGAAAEFPLRAADLADRFQGRALGDQLRAREQDWIQSGFQLSKDQLLR